MSVPLDLAVAHLLLGVRQRRTAALEMALATALAHCRESEQRSAAARLELVDRESRCVAYRRQRAARIMARRPVSAAEMLSARAHLDRIDADREAARQQLADADAASAAAARECRLARQRLGAHRERLRWLAAEIGRAQRAAARATELADEDEVGDSAGHRRLRA